MTPRRWTPNTRAWVYRYLILRDGEQCAICHAVPTTKNHNQVRTNSLVTPTPRNHEVYEQNHTRKRSSTTEPHNAPRRDSLVSPTTQLTLDIDHIDGNPKNENPDNLRLLCRRCNVATSNKSNARKSYSSDLCVCVCEKGREAGNTNSQERRKLQRG